VAAQRRVKNEPDRGSVAKLQGGRFAFKSAAIKLVVLWHKGLKGQRIFLSSSRIKCTSTRGYVTNALKRAEKEFSGPWNRTEGDHRSPLFEKKA